MTTSNTDSPADLPTLHEQVRAALGFDDELDAAVQELEDLLKHNDEPGLPYTPLLRAVNSHTRGYAERVPGIITARDHHFLSRHEWHAFILFDWRDDRYSNLREQFKLPLALTQLLAKRLNIDHPYNRFDGVVAQMSVDLVATLVGGGAWIAVDIKEDNALVPPPARRGKRRRSANRTLQKLNLAKVALELAGVEHSVLTPSQLPRIVVQNIRYLRRYRLPFDRQPLAGRATEDAEHALLALLRSGCPVDIAAKHAADATGIPAPELNSFAMSCVASRRWLVDFDKEIGPDLPLTFK